MSRDHHLVMEFEAALDGLDHAWIKRLQGLGIPKRVLFGVWHHLGVGRITTYSDGLFEFHDDGDLAIIVAEGEPEVPGWVEFYDLVAFAPDDPSRWWLRLGQVDLVGAYNMTPWKLSPTTIHETPLSWLRAGAVGICIVDWTCDPADVLLGAGGLRAESSALKAKLERRIKEAALEPFKITVAQVAPQAGGFEARDAA